MSIQEYVESSEISVNDPSFYALLFALMRKADTRNTTLIKNAWPGEWREMQARYNAPAGALNDEELVWHEQYFADKAQARREGT